MLTRCRTPDAQRNVEALTELVHVQRVHPAVLDPRSNQPRDRAEAGAALKGHAEASTHPDRRRTGADVRLRHAHLHDRPLSRPCACAAARSAEARSPAVRIWPPRARPTTASSSRSTCARWTTRSGGRSDKPPVADGAGTVSGGPLFDRRRRLTFRPARRIGPVRRDLRRSAAPAREHRARLRILFCEGSRSSSLTGGRRLQ